MLVIKESSEYDLASQRGGNREKRRGETRAHAVWLNDTSGDGAIPASNAVMFSVSLREVQQSRNIEMW